MVILTMALLSSEFGTSLVSNANGGARRRVNSLSDPPTPK